MGPTSSQTLLCTSGLSQSLSQENSLKVIRMGEGQLEGQLEWGDPQSRAEVQEEADNWPLLPSVFSRKRLSGRVPQMAFLGGCTTERKIL